MWNINSSKVNNIKILNIIYDKVSKGAGKVVLNGQWELTWAILDPKEALEGGGWDRTPLREEEAEIQTGKISESKHTVYMLWNGAETDYVSTGHPAHKGIWLYLCREQEAFEWFHDFAIFREIETTGFWRC